jgi:3-oxoacyl-[acyl-carrier-protein] synthase II
MKHSDREAWITGVGIISSLGDGSAANWQNLSAGRLNVDDTSFAPYLVHPLADVDFASQIPKAHLRTMDAWQRIGTYAAGLAIENAGLRSNSEVLARTDLMVVAGGGERDTALDCKVLMKMRDAPNRSRLLNETLMSDLRPTLFLSQLSNMLAGNISIVHGVTGSSRTFMGEEAGLEALRIALARINAGQSEVVLIGGAQSGERKDFLLFCEAGGLALRGDFAPVFQRQQCGGGLALGSFGTFLVVESIKHARARDARPLARLADVVTSRDDRERTGVDQSLSRLWKRLEARVTCGGFAVLSGAIGTEPATSQELAFLKSFDKTPVHATGTFVGHGFESQFSMNVALAALVASRGQLDSQADDLGMDWKSDHPIENVLVTGTGHRRGEGLALVERIHHA